MALGLANGVDRHERQVTVNLRVDLQINSGARGRLSGHARAILSTSIFVLAALVAGAPVAESAGSCEDLFSRSIARGFGSNAEGSRGQQAASGFSGSRSIEGSGETQALEAEIASMRRAESSEPSATYEIRASIQDSGGRSQYDKFDSPEMVGKRITAVFIEDSFRPGQNIGGYPVNQLVMTRRHLDKDARQFVAQIERRSADPSSGGFIEVGGWMIYTRQGVYKSRELITGTDSGISNEVAFANFDKVLAEAMQAEGGGIIIEDVEFYHSHLNPGELYSYGDLEMQERMHATRLKRLLRPGANFTSYAVPVRGENIFRSLTTQR